MEENQKQHQVFSLFLILFITSLFGCKAQVNQDCKSQKIELINNKTLPFVIALVSCDTCVPIRNIGYRVIVELNEKDEDTIKKIEKNCWLSLLNNNSTDWAANLMLYSLYNEDALILSRVDEKIWKSKMKEKDLKKWQAILK